MLIGRIESMTANTTIFLNPKVFTMLLGETIPSLSLYFCCLVIVKIFAALPLGNLTNYLSLFKVIIYRYLLN